jgi:hypothetical protein
MNGRMRGTKVRDFDSLIGSVTGDYSEQQKQVLSFLKAAGFGDLQILRPSSRYPTTDGLVLDLEVLDTSGQMIYSPELMRAFIALSRQLKFGLFIGASAPVLRIVMRTSGRERGVLLADQNGNDVIRYSNSPEFPATMDTLQRVTYGYTGDGNVDWSTFWKDQEDAKQKQSWLELVRNTVGDFKWITGAVAVLVVAYSGFRIMNEIRPFALLAGEAAARMKKRSRKK